MCLYSYSRIMDECTIQTKWIFGCGYTERERERQHFRLQGKNRIIVYDENDGEFSRLHFYTFLFRANGG